MSDSDVNSNAKKVTEAIIAAAKKCIPRGCRAKYKPFWNEKLSQAVKTREAARRKYMEDNTPGNRTEYNRCSLLSKREILSSERLTFQETCEEIDLSKEGTKAWSLIRNLNGEDRRSNPKPIVENGNTIADDQRKAERQNKYFASVNKANHLTEDDKEMLRELKSNEKAPRANTKLFDEIFSQSELKKAMKKLKSRESPGPDSIHNEMLTHLGNEGRKIILGLINLTWTKGELPRMWKIATIKPLLKKGKPAEEISSYRPISLTSCLGKLAERMINARLYWYLETSKHSMYIKLVLEQGKELRTCYFA